MMCDLHGPDHSSICWDGVGAVWMLCNKPGTVVECWNLTIFTMKLIFMHKFMSVGAYDS